MIDQTYLQALQETFPPKDFQYSTEFDSSNVACYAYDEKTKDLMVAFKGGRIYLYSQVPKSIFAYLENSNSKGKAVNAKVVKADFKFRTFKCYVE